MSAARSKKKSDSPVLITGATGLVGRALAEALRARATPVRALVRHSSKAAPLHDLGVELFVGDVTEPESLAAPMAGVDTVYHCAAYVGDWGPRARFERVNVGGAEHVAAAAVEAGVRRFVHLSSIAVYGPEPRADMTEDSPLDRRGEPYCDTKIDAERAVLAIAEDMEVTVIRPGLIYGPRDALFLPRLIGVMKRVPLPTPLGVDAIANLVYVRNVVAQCLVQAEAARAVGQAFNAIDAEPMRLLDMERLVATKAGARQPRGVVLPQAMRLTASALERVWKTMRLSSAPPLTRFAVDGALLVRPFCMEKVRWLLDFVPPYTMRQGLLETLAALAAEAEAAETGEDDWGHGWDEEAEDGSDGEGADAR